MAKCVLKIIVRITLIYIIIHESSSLRNARIELPNSAERNTKVVLKCLYELENETLYTVKWYRGENEFCRYNPGNKQPLKAFYLSGIEVVKEETDRHQVTVILTYPQAVVEGVYFCEVTADRPSFQTARVFDYMYVVDLPHTEPKLEVLGMKPRYRPGMKLKVECICRNTFPAANLSFYVNDHAARFQHVTHRVDVGDGTKELMSAFSTIQFVVRKHHFHEGKLRIRCVSEIYEIYYWSAQKCALEEVVRTTPSSTIVVLPINRKKKAPSKPASGTTLRITSFLFAVLPIVGTILPTVLR